MRLQPLIVLVLPILIHNLQCRGAPTCPLGQIKYKDFHNLCCVPIVSPNYCGLNKRIQRCTADGEPDVCVDCEDGKVNFSNSTSGVVEDRCFRQLGCTEEAIQSGNGQCQCDNSRCYYGDDEYSCLPLKAKCQENTYHKNGACVPCLADTHRPGIGCGPCVPMSSLAAPVNTISEAIPHLNTTNSAKTVPAVTTIRPDSLDIEEKDVPEDNKSAISESLSGIPDWASILIALVSAILIVLIGFGSVWFYRKRNRTGHVPLRSNPPTLPPSTENDRRHPPPPYAEFDTNRGICRSPDPSQINQDIGYPNGGATATCNNQTAQPYTNSCYDNHVESPMDGAGQSFQPVQPSSSSIHDLPPTGFSSGSSASQGSVSVHGPAPDHTNPKVAVCDQESSTEQQRAGKKPSSVVPAGDDADTPLLRSAPSLDPDSIKQDSQ